MSTNKETLVVTCDHSFDKAVKLKSNMHLIYVCASCEIFRQAKSDQQKVLSIQQKHFFFIVIVIEKNTLLFFSSGF